MWLEMEVKSNAVKSSIAQEHGILGPWIKANVNGQQKMEKVNFDILGVSKLKWTGMGEFNSDDRFIYQCGQESLRRNGVALIVNKRAWNAVFGYSLKHDNDLCSFPRQIIHITVIQVYAPTTNAEDEVERFFEALQDLLELTPKKDVLLIIGD